MTGRKRLFSLLLCSLFLLTACAAQTPNQVVGMPQTEEKLLTDVRTQYKNASLIVEGVCGGIHTNSQGQTCYDMHITQSLAGTVDVEKTMHYTGSTLQEGERYILFLQDGEDVPYAEDEIGYSLLSDEPLHVQDNEVLWNGKRLSVQALKDEIQELSKVIGAPAPVYYYDTLQALVDAADEVFIGQVVSLPEKEKMPFSIRDGGASQKTQYDASIARIRVHGSIKGSLGRYGQLIEMVYCPERADGMLDAATLQAYPQSDASAPAFREGQIYLFFLLNGPDAKQEYYFPVNPLQGFVNIVGDELTVSPENKPLSGYHTLTELVRVIHAVLNWVQPGLEDTPPLVIE